MWPFVETVAARRSSRNRPAEMEVLKSVTVTKATYKRMLVDNVLPSILARFPQETKTIVVQHDNATPHAVTFHAEVVAASQSGERRIVFGAQPANSPDLNILDLGFFNSIQSLQQKMPAYNIVFSEQVPPTSPVVNRTNRPCVHNGCHRILQKLLKQCMRDVARSDAFLIKKALDAVTYFTRERPVQRTKHLALHFYFLWDLVKSRKFTLTHLPTNVMPADVFTKHVPKDNPLLTGRSDPDPEKPNTAIQCAVKPLPHGYANTPFTAPTPTPVAAPFDSPAPAATPTGATNLPPVPDVADMGQGDERGFVYNAPALPDPPSFNGSSQSERRTFIRQYKKCLDQVNALQLNGSRPFVMPTEWAAWFSKAFGEEPQDLEVLKKRLTTAIRFDTTILDADSRIGKMLDNLMRALERDDQAWVLDQEGKAVVDIMVKAIKPVGLQQSVQRQLALQPNKPLKSNVYRFVDWLRVHTARYHLYAPVDDEKTTACDGSRSTIAAV
ncbi:hypothetical protein H257_07049 [Aphanomyces astaci]|uniref:Uncharacterized protein n=1 Tax=Aphanomyces astaci TaxID=112090 RepID=W4GLP6_APHAT|nr:hypothetical protein H257_07049 [Aphanomyces astaci]ETV79833.1 hypothetical protein H257_07049 [Aphanomyces astaci]|eukprot:XP_009830769.1 hypothetical protein H257_07049 [Aphanomyces astaci]